MAGTKHLLFSDFTKEYYPQVGSVSGRPLSAVVGGDRPSLALRPATATIVRPSEWRREYRANIGSAKKVISQSKNIELENRRLCEETADTTSYDKKLVDGRLDSSLFDIEIWREETSQLLLQLGQDVEALKTLVKRLKHQLDKFGEPLEINRRCLQIRSERAEQVADEVLSCLLQEQERLQHCRHLLAKAITETLAQVRRDVAVMHQLKKDFKEKCSAFHTDTQTRQMLPPQNLAHLPKLHKIGPSPLSVQDWENGCLALLQQGQQQHRLSLKAQSMAAGVLTWTCRAAREAAQRTDGALDRRICDTRHAKEELEDQRAKVVGEQQALERSLCHLDSQLRAKREPFALALSRMRARTARPYREQTRDDAETALYREIKDLQNNIRRLQDAGLATQRAAERLAAAKASLDEDIERKMKALHIDEVRVRGARTGIDLEEF